MRYLLSFILLVLAAIPVSAQRKGEPLWPWNKDRQEGYVHFGFDPNVEALVKDRLKLEQDLGPLKDLVKQILANPDKFPFDPAKLQNAKLDDPAMKEAVKNWLAQDPNLKEAVEKWIKEQPADKKSNTEQFQQNLKKLIEETPAKGNPLERPAAKQWPRQPPRVKPPVDPVAKAAEQAMKQAEEGKFGEWLSESPGWKRAFEDLRASMLKPDGTPWEVNAWQKRLGLDDQKFLEFGKGALSRLQNMPKPNIDGATWNRRLPGLSALPTPNLGTPSMPNFAGPSLPSVGTGATWLLILALTMLCVWQMLRWTKRKTSTADERASLGAWPIQPGAVSTRAELVLAFDYLALWTLGMRVTSWNHHAVARRWGEQSPNLASLAQSLASLYEASRYTDGIDELALPHRDQARQALTQLAEALR